MTQVSRFWDGTAVGDATAAPYDAVTEFSRVMQSISGAGGIATNQSAVFRGELNELAVTGVATPVSIASGRAITAGTWYENDAALTVAIPTPAVSTRIDRIVLRKDWSALVQTVRVTRIAGVEGDAAPALVQVYGTTWDEPLAQASITTGGVITVTDQRQFIGSGPFINLRTFAVGDLLYGDTTTTLARLAIGTATQVLQTNAGATAPQWTSTLLLALGAVGTPTYSFIGDSNTGAYSPAADTWAIATNGVQRIRIDNNGLQGAGYIRALGSDGTGNDGSGHGVGFQVASSTGIMYSYDRTAGAYKAARVDGLTVALAASGTDKFLMDANGMISKYTVPKCRVYNNANISVANGGSPTALTFNSERYDTDTMHDTGSNTSRITVKTAGTYHFEAQVTYASNATGLRYLDLFVNGALVIAGIEINAVNGDNTNLQISTDYDLAVNDYVEVRAFQSSGGALNAVTANNYSPEFMANRIG